MQRAVKTGRMATGESPKPKVTARHKGGEARAGKLTSEQRSKIAKKAAKARWKKKND